MEAKEMREELKAAGKPIPRSNEDVAKAHADMVFEIEIGGPTKLKDPAISTVFGEYPAEVETDTFEAEAESEPEVIQMHAQVMVPVPAVIKPKEMSLDGDVYTYVGAGDTPPHMIKFLGIQNFIRGQATVVTHPEVLDKIKNHPCFVKGEADQDVMFASDEAAAKEAQDRRDEDVKIQIDMDRVNNRG